MISERHCNRSSKWLKKSTIHVSSNRDIGIDLQWKIPKNGTTGEYRICMTPGEAKELVDELNKALKKIGPPPIS